VIDEAQKAPSLFDAVKSDVDSNKIPGTYYLSGSSTFSAQSDIRESLTGRIGLCYLYPMTLGESHEKIFQKKNIHPVHLQKTRFSFEEIAKQSLKGGLPVPLFSRDFQTRNQYWASWLSTTLGRDLSRVYGKGYNPDRAEKILFSIAALHKEGIFPSIADFDQDPRIVKKYLNAFRNIFMLQMHPCHLAGQGRDRYFITDSGLTHYLCKQASGEGLALSLVRIYVLNEIIASTHYSGQTQHWNYYKSSRGHPIDLVWNEIPIKVIGSLKQMAWHEESLSAAAKKLGSKYALLCGPTNQINLPTNKNRVGLVPWSFWS
jgi:predicted AAA+ superfamily ATPase